MKVWHLADSRFRTRVWDGEMILYDEGSGDTHCLDPLATSLLQFLQQNGAATVADLREAAAGKLEGDEDQHLEAVIADALEVLQTLRLVKSTEH